MSDQHIGRCTWANGEGARCVHPEGHAGGHEPNALAQGYQRSWEDLHDDQVAHITSPVTQGIEDFTIHHRAWATSEESLREHLMLGHGFMGGPSSMEDMRKLHEGDHRMDSLKQFSMEEVEPIGHIEVDLLTTIEPGKDAMVIAEAAGNISFAANLLGGLVRSCLTGQPELRDGGVFISHERVGAAMLRAIEVINVEGGTVVRVKK